MLQRNIEAYVRDNSSHKEKAIRHLWIPRVAQA